MSRQSHPPELHSEVLERWGLRTLTDRGTDLYELNRSKLYEKVENTWTDFENLIIDNDKSKLCDIRKLEIKTNFKQFVYNNNKYTQFLSHEFINAANEELNRTSIYYLLSSNKNVDAFLEKLRTQKLELVEKASTSRSSLSSFGCFKEES